MFILCLNLNAQTKKWSIYECVDYAIENNISLKQQVLNSEAAEEDIIAAKGNFLPNLSASVNQNWNFGSSIGQDGVRISRDTRGNNFGLNTGVTLFDGMRNVNNLEQAKLSLVSTELQKDILQDDITINILTRYIDILAQKENLKIALQQVGVTEKQIGQIQELVNAGVRAKSELLDVQAQLASDNETVVNAESSVELALLSLSELLQIPYNGFDIQDVDLNISSVSLLYNSADEIYEKAVETRAEIEKAQLDIESSELNVDLAKGAYYPTLSFGAGLGSSYQHSQGSEDVRATFPDPSDPTNIVFVDNGWGEQINNNLGYNFGFRLSVPIFNRMQVKSNVNKNIINQKRAENSLDQSKQDLYSTCLLYTSPSPRDRG